MGSDLVKQSTCCFRSTAEDLEYQLGGSDKRMAIDRRKLGKVRSLHIELNVLYNTLARHDALVRNAK